MKFFLFEYEEYLRQCAKGSESKISWSDFRGAKKSVEHVYPQNAMDDEWPAFQDFSGEQKRVLTHSLGNLVAVSVAKNASLSRSAFRKKKAGTAEIPGFSQGSFSELRIALNDEWIATDILRRGFDLLKFLEDRWGIQLSDVDAKTRLLKLGFLGTEASGSE